MIPVSEIAAKIHCPRDSRICRGSVYLWMRHELNQSMLSSSPTVHVRGHRPIFTFRNLKLGCLHHQSSWVHRKTCLELRYTQIVAIDMRVIDNCQDCLIEVRCIFLNLGQLELRWMFESVTFAKSAVPRNCRSRAFVDQCCTNVQEIPTPTTPGKECNCVGLLTKSLSDLVLCAVPGRSTSSYISSVAC